MAERINPSAIAADKRYKKYKPNKNNKLVISKKGMLIFVSISFVVLMLFAGYYFTKNKNAIDTPYIYSDGKVIYVTTNMAKDTTYELPVNKYSDTVFETVRFDEKSGFLYFFSEYDEKAKKGTFSRIDYKNLKDKKPEVISNGNVSFFEMDDTGIIYETVKGNDTNFKKSLMYIKNVAVGAKLSEAAAQAVQLVTDYEEAISCDDFSKIAIAVNEDEATTVYLCSAYDKKAEKLAVVSSYGKAAGGFFYTTEDGISVLPYQFVTDKYEKEDAGKKMPQQADYMIPEYDYRLLYESEYADALSDSEMTLYTSTTLDVPFCKKYLFFNSSIEYAAEHDWAYGEEYQKFVEKYKGNEDENGLIPLTDSVKENLIAMVTACGKSSDDYVQCCFVQYESGQTVDAEAYQAAKSEYDKIADRIAIRNKLKDSNNSIKLKTLHGYASGIDNIISDSVFGVKYDNGMVYFSEEINDTIAIDKVTSIEDIKSFLDNNEITDYKISGYPADGSQGIYSPKDFGKKGLENCKDIRFTEDGIFYVSGSKQGCNLCYIDNSGEKLTLVEKVSKEKNSFDVTNDGAYFVILSDGALKYINNDTTKDLKSDILKVRSLK